MQNAISGVWGEGSFLLAFISLLHFFFSCKKMIFSLLSSNIYWKSQKNAIYMNQIVWVKIVLVTICLKSACCTTIQFYNRIISAHVSSTALSRRRAEGQWFIDTESQGAISNLSSPHLEEVIFINKIKTHMRCRQHISPGPSSQHLSLL